jgi:hypothetical protein
MTLFMVAVQRKDVGVFWHPFGFFRGSLLVPMSCSSWLSSSQKGF